MKDRFIDFFYSGLKFSTGEVVVTRKAFLKGIDFIFKIGNVNVLVPHEC
jgi:hypothetical protein